MKGKHHTKESRKKLSKAHLGKKNYFYGKHHTEETKKKLSLANTGKHHTIETKRKMSLTRMGHITTEETKQKISEANKGNIPWSKGLTKEDDIRLALIGEKTRIALTGYKHSKKSRENMSLGKKGQPNGWKGKHHTKESREKMRLVHIGQASWNKGKTGVYSKETIEKIRNTLIDWDFYNEHGCLKSNYPYNDCFTEEFKDVVRARDGNKCVVTGMTNEEHKAKYGKSLCVHHWTYDKDETNPFYFVTVTCGINIAAEANRGEWIDMFNGILEDKYCESK